MTADLLIVGGTAAGTAAAAAARRAAPRARIVLVDAGGDVAYSTCELPMYAGGQVQERDELVRYTPEAFSDAFSIDVRPFTRITGFSADGRTALTAGDGPDVGFRHLILATGAKALVPEALVNAPNVHVLRTLEDAVGLKKAVDPTRVHHAVVVGGGYVGLEVAHALHERSVRVTLVQPGGHVVRGGIDAHLASHVIDRMRVKGVAVRDARVIGADRSPDGKIMALRTDDGEKIGCQLVVAATGIAPRTELSIALGLRLEENGALRVSEGMNTSLPHVWACGDAVAVPNVLTEGWIWAPLAMQAFRTGRVAGANAVAALRPSRTKPSKLEGVVPTYAVHCFDRDIAHTGLRLEHALASGFKARAIDITGASCSRLLGGSDVHIRLVFDAATGRVLGSETVGPSGSALRMNTVAALIRLRGTIDDLDAADTVYHPMVAPMHDPLRIAAHKARATRWD